LNFLGLPAFPGFLLFPGLLDFLARKGLSLANPAAGRGGTGMEVAVDRRAT
jgi:hypothetical protein